MRNCSKYRPTFISDTMEDSDDVYSLLYIQKVLFRFGIMRESMTGSYCGGSSEMGFMSAEFWDCFCLLYLLYFK